MSYIANFIIDNVERNSSVYFEFKGEAENWGLHHMMQSATVQYFKIKESKHPYNFIFRWDSDTKRRELKLRDSEGDEK